MSISAEILEKRLALPKSAFRGFLKVPKDGIFCFTDPCYIPNSLDKKWLWCRIKTNWGDRGIKVAGVCVDYRDNRPARIYVSSDKSAELGVETNNSRYTRVDNSVGVDSGQVIVLAEKKLKLWNLPEGDEYNNDPTNSYKIAMDITLDSAESGDFMMDNWAFVSSTNYGDGAYAVWQRESDFFVDLIGDFREEENGG